MNFNLSDQGNLTGKTKIFARDRNLTPNEVGECALTTLFAYTSRASLGSLLEKFLFDLFDFVPELLTISLFLMEGGVGLGFRV